MMDIRRKLVLIVVSFLIISTDGFAQQSATTKDGKEVILHQDGRWTYTGQNSSSVQTKPLTAKKTYKGKNGYYGLSLDESKWLPNKKSHEAHEFSFVHTDGDVYAATIAERIEFSEQKLTHGVLENAKEAGIENIKVTKEEKRVVNGKQFRLLV